MGNVSTIRPKEVIIELEGASYPIRYTLNAFAELEDKYGTVENAMSALQKGSIKAVRAILWAGMIYKHPSLTELEVGAMIDMDDMARLSDVITLAITGSLPDPEPETTEAAVARPLEQ